MTPTLRATAAIAACACIACSDTDPVEPPAGQVESMTVNAATGWSFVAFNGESASTITPADRSTSAAWDVGFFATSVMLNGGAAGPAGVAGHCICTNESASSAQIMAMTSESMLAEFASVTEADIPAEGEAWLTDALAPAIDRWYSYDPVAHAVTAAPDNVWMMRTASGGAFAKFHVTGLEDATQTHAGRVTFEYALQPSAGAAFEPAQSVTVDVSSGAVSFDLETGVVVTGSSDWDVRFEGYDIRVNGGVSGSGSAGALLSGESFGAVTDASDLPSNLYAGDAFGGVFDDHPWYRYNLEGNHQIWPTFDVYLIHRGESVWKVQLTSYYGPTGDSRQITFRYARLR
jgi:hypothetical protein